MDMNRNVLLRNPDDASSAEVARMNRFWGDESWRDAAYSTRNLFDLEMKSDNANQALSDAFRKRLRDVAGFGYVPDALPMRNSIGRVIYYLVFASPKEVAGRIVTDIFAKYRTRGLTN
jgi:three-Cys-motif partner protein